MAALEDPVATGFPGLRRPEGVRPAVQGLAWVTATPSLLVRRNWGGARRQAGMMYSAGTDSGGVLCKGAPKAGLPA